MHAWNVWGRVRHRLLLDHHHSEGIHCTTMGTQSERHQLASIAYALSYNPCCMGWHCFVSTQSGYNQCCISLPCSSAGARYMKAKLAVPSSAACYVGEFVMMLYHLAHATCHAVEI